MALLHEYLGEEFRRERLDQKRTLREVASCANISSSYLQEVETGAKLASSQVIESICKALYVSLSEVLRNVAVEIAIREILEDSDKYIRGLRRNSESTTLASSTLR
jgi:transcriptional regulator with XRE-family HTH domain